MKKNKVWISYLIGVFFFICLIISFIRMIPNINSNNFSKFLPNIACYIGALIFVLTRILGLFPINFDKKLIFDEIIDKLYLESEKKPIYNFPNALYKRFKKDIRNEESLNLLAKSIVSYCGVDSSKLKVKVNNELISAAGTFNRNTNVINISLVNTRFIDEVLAVLIHECMHYVLREKNIYYEETLKNEYLTDIACLFFGFENYINGGYIMIGYLKRNELRYVKNRINERDY